MSVLPSVPAFSWIYFLSFFLNLGMVLQNFIKLYVTEPNILEISFCTKNWENGPKKRFFEFIEKFGYYFLHNLFYIENFYYFLCSCTNPIFEKILFLRYGPMFSANRWQDFLIHHIFRKNQWNSLIFCPLIQKQSPEVFYKKRFS